MKNIIIVLLILILPIVAYIYMSNNIGESVAATRNSDVPTVITFTSSMCMDCQKIKSVLAEIEPNYSQKVNFEYVQALDKSKKVKDSIKKYGVVLVPTMIFIDKNGKQLNKIEGFLEKEKLEAEIEELING